MRNRFWLCARIVIAAAALFAQLGCSKLNKSQAETRAIANIGEAGRQLTLGNEAQARVWLDRGVAWNPSNLSTYLGSDAGADGEGGTNGLIACLFSHNDWPDLALYLSKAVNDPKIASNWLVWQALAQAQAQLGQSAAARQSYDKELDILNDTSASDHPDVALLSPEDLLINRADALWGAGRQSLARADFERFIARYPQFAAQAQNDLAYSEAVANVDLPNAYALAQAAVASIRINADAPDQLVGAYVDTLGWVQYRMGDYSQAAKNAEEAISEDPDEPEIHYHLAKIYQALGDLPDAKIEIDRSASLCTGNAETEAALRQIDPTFSASNEL